MSKLTEILYRDCGSKEWYVGGILVDSYDPRIRNKFNYKDSLLSWINDHAGKYSREHYMKDLEKMFPEHNFIDASVAIYMLSEDILEIKFVKADGTERVMECTTDPDLIPKEHQPKGESNRKENPNQVRVFSFTDGGWRSFNVNRLLDWQLVDDEY